MNSYTEIQTCISEANDKQDFDEVARLAQIASQLKSLDEQKGQLLAAVQPSAPPQVTTLPPIPRTNALHVPKPSTEARVATRGGLTVELTTKSGAPIRISERTASDTLVVLMERILTHFGMSGLEKLTGLRVGRGPLVSRDPRKDYSYGNGRTYAHHRIPGTNLHVLTHSSSDEKLEFIPAALRMVGLTDGSFRVSLS